MWVITQSDKFVPILLEVWPGIGGKTRIHENAPRGRETLFLSGHSYKPFHFICCNGGPILVKRIVWVDEHSRQIHSWTHSASPEGLFGPEVRLAIRHKQTYMKISPQMPPSCPLPAPLPLLCPHLFPSSGHLFPYYHYPPLVMFLQFIGPKTIWLYPATTESSVQEPTGSTKQPLKFHPKTIWLYQATTESSVQEPTGSTKQPLKFQSQNHLAPFLDSLSKP